MQRKTKHIIDRKFVAGFGIIVFAAFFLLGADGVQAGWHSRYGRSIMHRDDDRALRVSAYWQHACRAQNAADAPDDALLVKEAMTSVFWIGEGATEENGFISNAQSAWDSAWQEHFGGIDDPLDRCGYHPCAFTPAENPFYVALPYNDLSLEGTRKPSAMSVPWYAESASALSILKNAWVEVAYQDRVCYGQWEDVGPNETDDFGYVFGDAVPQNTFGVGAGLDVSPALRDCLGMTDNAVTSWRFVDAEDVPAGPWADIVTTRGVSY